MFSNAGVKPLFRLSASSFPAKKKNSERKRANKNIEMGKIKKQKRRERVHWKGGGFHGKGGGEGRRRVLRSHPFVVSEGEDVPCWEWRGGCLRVLRPGREEGGPASPAVEWGVWGEGGGRGGG